MNSPDFPILPLLILTFFAGFAAAIWLATLFDQGAREIAENVKEADKDNLSLGG